MQRTHIRALAALLLLFTLSTLTPLTVVSSAHAADQALADPFGQFDLPGNPKNVYLETAARIWFTLPDSDQIVLLQPNAQADVTAAAADAVTPFPTGAGTKPYDLVMLGGSVWFTAPGTNQIGRLNPGNGQVDLFNIPTAASEPSGIAAGGVAGAAGERLGYTCPVQGSGRDTGTDADAMTAAGIGTAAGVLSIPNRYMHSPNEVVSLSDLDQAARLLAEFARSVMPETTFIPE